MDSAPKGSMIRRGRTRRIAGLIAGLAVVAAVAGCGPVLAGSAAVVGDERITDPDLEYQVNQVTAALNLEPSEKANQIVLDRMIRGEIFDYMSQQANVEISDGALNTFISTTEKQVGGADKLAQQLLQSGVPGSEISNFARTFLQQQQLAAKLAPGKSPQVQGAALGAAAIKVSKELDVRVSPRFGSWNPEQLSVGPTPNDLSVPAPSANPNLQQLVPQQQQPPQQP